MVSDTICQCWNFINWLIDWFLTDVLVCFGLFFLKVMILEIKNFVDLHFQLLLGCFRFKYNNNNIKAVVRLEFQSIFGLEWTHIKLVSVTHDRNCYKLGISTQFQLNFTIHGRMQSCYLLPYRKEEEEKLKKGVHMVLPLAWKLYQIIASQSIATK